VADRLAREFVRSRRVSLHCFVVVAGHIWCRTALARLADRTRAATQGVADDVPPSHLERRRLILETHFRTSASACAFAYASASALMRLSIKTAHVHQRKAEARQRLRLKRMHALPSLIVHTNPPSFARATVRS